MRTMGLIPFLVSLATAGVGVRVGRSPEGGDRSSARCVSRFRLGRDASRAASHSGRVRAKQRGRGVVRAIAASSERRLRGRRRRLYRLRTNRRILRLRYRIRERLLRDPQWPARGRIRNPDGRTRVSFHGPGRSRFRIANGGHRPTARGVGQPRASAERRQQSATCSGEPRPVAHAPKHRSETHDPRHVLTRAASPRLTIETATQHSPHAVTPRSAEST